MALVLGGGKTGGSSQPHTQEQFLLAPSTSIANAASVILPWGVSGGPDSLLNVTAPTLPAIITAGIYAFTVQVAATNVTVGGYIVATFTLDAAVGDFAITTTSALTTAADGPAVAFAATWYMTAGMQVKVETWNRDGVSARDFFLVAFVQRVG